MMGAGKTSVGRELVERSGRFIDLDRLIETRTGRTVRQIFKSDGEPMFRLLECEALSEVLNDPQVSVVSTGGGIVTTVQGRQLLNSSYAYVVWLTASNPELVRRATKSGTRPLLDNEPEAKIAQLVKERTDLYAEVADLTVDTENLSVNQVAQIIDESFKRKLQ